MYATSVDPVTATQGRAAVELPLVDAVLGKLA